MHRVDEFAQPGLQRFPLPSLFARTQLGAPAESFRIDSNFPACMTPCHRRGWSEFHDRYIRDGEHLAFAKSYIEENPWKAELCPAPEKWRWSSAWEGREK